ncbi:MAG TPA: helix-turn-helix domain-containing protein [Candidatus Thermoplasmatota archaeon]|nr:helix-turn-helix domain-containing protein [Candidatus Thermoplasmatota archaeon]
MARRATANGRPGIRKPEDDHVKCTEQSGGCEIQDLFRLLGKSHTLDILHLFVVQEPSESLRFVEVQNALKLSPNTLSERLKELVEAGLLGRTAYNEIPPRVDYQATRKARELEPVFQALIEWSRRNDLAPVSAGAAPESAVG